MLFWTPAQLRSTSERRVFALFCDWIAHFGSCCFGVCDWLSPICHRVGGLPSTLRKKKSSPEASINQRGERKTRRQRSRNWSLTKVENIWAKYSSERGDKLYRNGLALIQDLKTCELDDHLDYFCHWRTFLNLSKHCACARQACAGCLRKAQLRFTLGWICRGRDEREEAIGRRAELQSARLLCGGPHRHQQKAEAPRLGGEGSRALYGKPRKQRTARWRRGHRSVPGYRAGLVRNHAFTTAAFRLAMRSAPCPCVHAHFICMTNTI